MIRLEVLGGARSAHAMTDFRADFEAIRCDETRPMDWRRAEDISFRLNRKGLRVPAGDVLIAAVAISRKLPLWHADRDF